MGSLPQEAKVVVIGGGIAGCSTAYHLANNGWDTVLIERDVLTSGTTWHAAGMVTQLGTTPQITKIRKNSVKFYNDLKDITGLDTSFRQTGTINIATTKSRHQEFMRQKTMSKLFNLEIEIIDKKKFKTLYPIAKNKDVLSGLYIPEDGQADPEILTKTISIAAKKKGVKIIEKCKLEKIIKRGNQIRGVKTNLGTIDCEYIVLCAGMWSRQIGEAAGVSIPLYPNEHFYMITEDYKNLPKDLPTFRDPDTYLYAREYHGKMMLGIFEPNAKNAFKKTGKVPNNFSFGEFKVDKNYIKMLHQLAAKRIPTIKNLTIEKYFSGPESFTPDSNFLLGETEEIKNFYVCCGFNSIGIGSSGGAGKAIAEWMIKGHTNQDLFNLDVKRFEKFNSSLKFIKERTTETLGDLFKMHWPYKQLETARNIKLLPYHKELKKLGACFGQTAGYERPMWFSRNKKPIYKYSYGNQNWYEFAKKECIGTRKNLGFFDLTPFVKFDLSGKYAHEQLQYLCANNIKNIQGRTTYTQMLNLSGGIEADLTVSCLKKNYFRIICPALARSHNKSHILKNLTKKVKFEDVTDKYSCMGLFGPNSRKFLTELFGNYFSNDNFPFSRGMYINISNIKIWFQRLSFVGELGWEIYIPIKKTKIIFEKIKKLGKKYKIIYSGMHALDILRLEKKFLHWGHDITSENNPFEAGLSFAVNFKKKENFIGRKILEKIKNKPLKNKLDLFSLKNNFKPGAPLMLHDEPIFKEGKIVGYTTSSNYSFFYKKNLCFAYVKGEIKDKEDLSVEIEGKKYSLRLEKNPIHDVNSKKMRS
ncbi:MAG: FAD-dependent oxidoreductase [Candidatus Pelagibacter sp. TMED286]|nr:MAG: FAD-dependent oxidoreductase [Candidatus Pelagibacter sp. TMED286]